MKTSRIQPPIRWILLLCGLALMVVLFVPMWRIDLVAPQYPEGLMLLIHPHKLAGNVDIINGLNHYIGMKTLHTKDFMEFAILPYIIAGFAALFILIAIIAKRKYLNILFILFVLFGVLAMYDFWRWEYNYGHDLDPAAAIIVPGMAYQPPLIGFKQLLNFGAYSMPDIGGWIFIGVGLLTMLAVLAEWRYAKKMNKALLTATLFVLSFSSCKVEPEPIKVGIDQCYFCKMTISDQKFGAEIVTQKGKLYKFDEALCLVYFLNTKEVQVADTKGIYLTDFCGTHQLGHVEESVLLQSEFLRSPMAGNIAAFSNKDSLLKMQQRYPGNIITWSELTKE